IPLRFVKPRVAGRNAGNALRFHRRIRRRDRKVHYVFFFLVFFSGGCNTLKRSKRFFPSTGFQRSPSFSTRATMLSMRKSSILIPPSTSSQVTGAETLATGVGRDRKSTR